MPKTIRDTPAGRAAGPAADAVIDSLPEPVIVVDVGGNVTFLNAVGQVFLQGSEAVLTGVNLQDLIPHDSPILAVVDRVRRIGTSMTIHGIYLSTPRIGSHMVTVDAAPLSDQPDSVVITIKKHPIAGRIDCATAQNGAVRSVTALASMLAHEVKNPLSGIRGAAQLLETMVPPGDRQLTKLIAEETDRIVRLLDRMEIFSDWPNLEREPVNIHEVLNRVLDIARNGFARGYRLVATYDPSLPPILGDRDQLVQVFLNLVKNAADAVSDGAVADPAIMVSTTYRHGVRLAVPGREAKVHLPLVVSVCDNGPGVSEDLRPHLFDPFITTKANGSGLGLALVAKLVSEHGGAVDFERKPQCTAFNVMLPVLRDGAEDAGAEDEEGWSRP